mmetsp:Transcript_29399/g.44437  ORF Transcript_29399/g.44437 Transcript_29399/m.44437 type:complete len:183 (+) Transcript_29399:2304-2852(+)
MVFIYALVSPAITLFGAIYFGIKYTIDKYLLCVVYPKDYEGKGEISRNIYYLANFTLVFQQVIMLFLFITTLKRKNFFWALVAFMALQLIIKVLFSLLNFGKIQDFFRRRGNYMTEEEEMKWEYDHGRLSKVDRKFYEDNFLNKEPDQTELEIVMEDQGSDDEEAGREESDDDEEIQKEAIL